MILGVAASNLDNFCQEPIKRKQVMFHRPDFLTLPEETVQGYLYQVGHYYPSRIPHPQFSKHSAPVFLVNVNSNEKPSFTLCKFFPLC